MTLKDRRRALVSADTHGTWEDLFWHIDKGDYATKYVTGEILPLDLGTLGLVNAQIVAFDTDVLSNGEGTAPVTFLAQHLLKESQKYNNALSGEPGNYIEGTGTIGGWGKSYARTYYRDTVYNAIPSIIRNRIVEVKKTFVGFDTTGTKSRDMQSDDTVWMPSMYELFGGTSYESSGVRYYKDTWSKHKPNGTSSALWWARTAGSTSSEYRVRGGASTAASVTRTGDGFCIGFCVK